MNSPSQVLLQKWLQLLHDLVVDASPAREQEIVHLLLPGDTQHRRWRQCRSRSWQRSWRMTRYCFRACRSSSDMDTDSSVRAAWQRREWDMPRRVRNLRKLKAHLDLQSQVVSALLEGLEGCGRPVRPADPCVPLCIRMRLAHAEAELGVVLEQRVGPGWALTLGVDGVREGRVGAAPDGRAASTLKKNSHKTKSDHVPDPLTAGWGPDLLHWQ